MREAIEAYPLTWPQGWPRKKSRQRRRAKFSTSGRVLSVMDGIQRVLLELERLGVKRDDLVISTDIPTRLDGLPRSDRSVADPGVAVYWRKGKDTRCMAVDRYDRVADNLAAIAATLEAMRAIERHGGAEILDRAFTGFVALPAPEQCSRLGGRLLPRPCRPVVAARPGSSLGTRHRPRTPWRRQWLQRRSLGYRGLFARAAPPTLSVAHRWQVLGVAGNATGEEIDAAYRRLAALHHPDRGGDSAQMARINTARDQGLAGSS